MKSNLYPRLAFSGIKQNKQYYKPYFFAGMLMTAMFYTIAYLANSRMLSKNLTSLESVKAVLTFGMFTIAIFCVVFILYTNSFLFKRRLKEFGLYNVLGMEKRHIIKMLAYESIYMSCSIIISGIAVGILFSRLCFLILMKMLNVTASVGFDVPGYGILITAVLFFALYMLAFFMNALRIRKADTIKLIYGGNEGEKKPKANPLIAIAGAACLVAGYVMAINISSPLAALEKFFIAVDLVIAGTYMVFISTSVWILTLLKKNKRYYYRQKHFVNVSGMLYRMKQNAVGMANICILSTMVLVTVSTCVSIYSGAELTIKSRCPSDVTVNVSSDNPSSDEKIMTESAKQAAMQNGVAIKSLKSYTALSLAALKTSDNVFSISNKKTGSLPVEFAVMTVKTYNRIYGTDYKLKGNEIIHYVSNNIGYKGNTLKLGDTQYTVKGYLKEQPTISDLAAYVSETHYIIVADDSVMEHIYNEQKQIYGENSSDITVEMLFDLSGTDEQKTAVTDTLYKNLKTQLKGGIDIEDKVSLTKTLRGFDSGFLFLGVFLGLTFAIATVLIIYYKQISEGYDDKKRFEIMQNVGMSREEIKKNTDSQVIWVFFLPLAVSCLHLLGSSKMMIKILVLFGVMQNSVFIISALCTVGVFALIYSLVYLKTSGIYEKIVEK